MALTPFGRRLTGARARGGSAFGSIRDAAVGVQTAKAGPRKSLFSTAVDTATIKGAQIRKTGGAGTGFFGRALREVDKKTGPKKLTPEQRKAKQEQMKKRKGQQAKGGPTRARAAVDRTRKVGASDKGKSLIGR